jgi:hypothetical protein
MIGGGVGRRWAIWYFACIAVAMVLLLVLWWWATA